MTLRRACPATRMRAASRLAVWAIVAATGMTTPAWSSPDHDQAAAGTPAAQSSTGVDAGRGTAVARPASHRWVGWGVPLAVCSGALLAWVLMRLGRPAPTRPPGTVASDPGTAPADRRKEPARPAGDRDPRGDAA